MDVLEGWEDVITITLTVDREGTCGGRGFSSPAEAYAFVTDNRLIPRLMAELGQDRYIKVLEYQMETGEGWPHWHIEVPERVDVWAVRNFWINEWQVGGRSGVNLRGRWDPVRKRMVSKASAVRYVTKYLDGGKSNMPEWAMDGYPQFFSQGRAVQSFSAWLLAKREPRGGVLRSREVGERGSGRRPLRERLAGCGRGADLNLCSGVYAGDGGRLTPSERERLGRVECTADVLVRAAERVGIKPECVEWSWSGRARIEGDGQVVDRVTGKSVALNRRTRFVRRAWFKPGDMVALLHRLPRLDPLLDPAWNEGREGHTLWGRLVLASPASAAESSGFGPAP